MTTEVGREVFIIAVRADGGDKERMLDIQRHQKSVVFLIIFFFHEHVLCTEPNSKSSYRIKSQL
jgi:hypothetical protein